MNTGPAPIVRDAWLVSWNHPSLLADFFFLASWVIPPGFSTNTDLFYLLLYLKGLHERMLGAKARSLTMLKMNKLLPAHLFLHPHQTMLLRLIISVEMPTDLKDRLGRPKRHLLQPPFIPLPTSTQHQLLKRLYSPRLLMEANRSPP